MSEHESQTADEPYTQAIDLKIDLTKSEFSWVAKFAGETMDMETAMSVLLRGAIHDRMDEE